MADAKASLPQCDRGATAVEFALIAPVLMMLMLAIVDTGMVMFAKGVLENATFTASRIGKTGYVESQKNQKETILAQLNKRASSMFDPTKMTIESKAYGEFDDIGTPEPFIDANGNGTRDTGENYTDVNGNGQYDEDVGRSGYGSASEVVVYTVSYPWKMHTPILAEMAGDDDGIVTLTSRVVVQNEPY